MQKIRRTRGRGTRYQMTDAWKAGVDAELERRGWSRTDLARNAGLAKSVISAMLSPRQVASDAVPVVCQVLGLPMPVVGAVDGEVIEEMAKLSDEDKRAVLELIRRLAK